MRFPEVRKKLLELVEDDQRERRGGLTIPSAKISKEEWMEPDWARARELLDILARIGLPSVKNIGLDGSMAVWLIAQHNSDYLDTGTIVLKKMRYLYYKDKEQVFYRGIPHLVDRLMVQKNNWAKTNKQLYGTQVYHEDGTVHRYPIINEKRLGERLRKFDLTIEDINVVPEG